MILLLTDIICVIVECRQRKRGPVEKEKAIEIQFFGLFSRTFFSSFSSQQATCSPERFKKGFVHIVSLLLLFLRFLLFKVSFLHFIFCYFFLCQTAVSAKNAFAVHSFCVFPWFSLYFFLSGCRYFFLNHQKTTPLKKNIHQKTKKARDALST